MLDGAVEYFVVLGAVFELFGCPAGEGECGDDFFEEHFVVEGGAEEVVMLVAHVRSQSKQLDAQALVFLQLPQHSFGGAVQQLSLRF